MKEKQHGEAIEKGLKALGITKEDAEIKVLENEDKRSFFSILAPRVVKVQLTVKENKTSNEVVKKERKEIELSAEEQEKAKKNIEKFLNEFLEKVQKGAQYSINMSKDGLKIDIKDNNLGFLIGYRGETLYALQSILSSVASKDIENRVRVILDIEGYKSKREKALEDLAEKLAKTVVNTRKSVTLEPMQAYERKIIHAKLQSNNMVETRSIGEEPRRRIVISLKRK